MPTFKLTVNGKRQVIEATPEIPLLYVLRNDLQLNGPKFGCGLAQCGACTVHVRGEAVRSCVVPISTVGDDAEVTTLEGLGSPEKPHPIQQAFIDEQAAQCAYCINGMIMQAAALLKRMPDPDESQIRDALAENLCRCGTHVRIVKAVKRAASAMRQARQ
jgi:nicotinate dehydrogenase subunit A